MLLTADTITFCTLASFVAGVVDSVAGGGGLITMPALLLSGVPPHLTMGTNKFSATLGTVAALINQIPPPEVVV